MVQCQLGTGWGYVSSGCGVVGEWVEHNIRSWHFYVRLYLDALALHILSGFSSLEYISLQVIDSGFLGPYSCLVFPMITQRSKEADVSVSQSVVRGLPHQNHLGDFLEMQISGLKLRPPKSDL